jgi:hypothetical protein
MNQTTLFLSVKRADHKPWLASAFGLMSCALAIFAILLGTEGSLRAQYAPPAAGLLGWWRGEGNGNDSSGLGHNGTLQNGGGYATGVVSQAFSFGGNANRLVIPDNGELNISNSISIGAWIYGKASSWHVLEHAGSSPGAVSYSIGLDNAGHLWFVVKSEGGGEESLYAPIPLNQWKYITGTLDDATGDMRLYINGTLVTNRVTSVRPFMAASSQPALGIGNTPWLGTFPFIGLIDEVVLYSRALTSDEVKSLATISLSTSIGLFPGITFSGQPGLTYAIQSVTNLTQTNSWTTLTNITLTQTQQLWVDTSADATSPNNPRRFYRAVLVP